MKFKTPIEVQAGISDGDPINPLGQAGYLLSSDGSQVSWVSPGGLSAETAEAIVQPIKANEALVKGDPVYIVGFNLGQNTNIVAKADSSDPTKMPAVGLADADYANQAFGTMTAFGSFNGAFDTSGGTENWAIGDIIFVKPGGGLTNIKPTSLSLIQNVAIVSRVSTQTGELEVIALGRTNDVPNLPSGRLFVGTPANTSLASDVVYVDDTNDSLIVNGTTLQTTESLSVIGSGYFSDKISIGTASSTVPGDNSYTLNLLDLNSAMAFGDNSQTSRNVIVGEYGTTDTDQLWLHGKNGTFFTHNNPPSIAGVIDSLGKFGLGITAPTEKLDVAGVIRNVYQPAPAAIGTVISKTLSFATDPYGIVNRGYASGVHSIQVEREDTPSQTFNLALQPTGGNLGVGTIAPASKLQVEDDSPTLILNHNGNTNAARCEISARQFGVAAPAPIGTLNWNYGLAGNSSIWSYYNASNAAHNFLKLDQVNGFIVSLSGSEKMRVIQNGNLGIGTTTPSFKLDVANGGIGVPWDSTGITFVNFQTVGSSIKSNTSSDLIFNTRIASSPYTESERMRILSNGNVGIGTDNPISELEIAKPNGYSTLTLSSAANLSYGGGGIINVKGAGTDYTAFALNIQTANGTQEASMGYSAGAGRTWAFDANQRGLSGGGHTSYKFQNNGSSQMVIYNNNIGIGTTAPSTKLEVIGGSTYQTINIGISKTDNAIKRQGITFTHYDVQEQDVSMITSYIDGATSFVTVGGGSANHNAAEIVRFYTASNTTTLSGIERMRVAANGNVGIATTSPSSKLQVNGGVQLANDTATASAGKAGTFRYRTSGNNSYVDMCMQTGSTTWTWINIVQNNW